MKKISEQLDKLFEHGMLYKGKLPDYVILSADYLHALQWEPVPSDCGKFVKVYGKARTHHQGVPIHKNPHAGIKFMQIGWGQPFLEEVPVAK